MSAKNAVQTVDQQIQALASELFADEVQTAPGKLPKLEVYTDKNGKRGVFTVDYGDDGAKEELGSDLQVIMLGQGDEVRAIFPEGSERPLCSARNGVPYSEARQSENCASCIYTTWTDDNKPYTDANGERCRTKRHLPVEVLFQEGDKTALMPAVLIVPPTSLGNEKRYRGSFFGRARRDGSASLERVITKLGAEYIRAAYEYCRITFGAGKAIQSVLTEEDMLTFLKDKKAYRDSRGAQEETFHDDIASAQKAPKKKKKKSDTPSDEDGTGAGTHDVDGEPLPF